MPELPEVETIVRGLKKTILGKKIEEVKILHPGIIKGANKNSAKQIIGQKIEDIRRRGKNILICLSKDKAILVHLGMSGHIFYLSQDRELDKHDHVIFRFTGGRKEIRYNDPRRFGKVKLVDLGSCPDLDKLGSEPLEVSLKDFVNLMKKRKGRIKTILLNQEVLAGIGNIYADESLFEAKINPLKKANQISLKRLYDLHAAIRKILKKAIVAGGSSIRTYTDLSDNRGRFQLSHKVYGRKGSSCKRCGAEIKRRVINQRSNYYCPQCQRV